MKGLAKLKRFANDLSGKTITDVIEALYSVEVEDEIELKVLAMVNKYHPCTKSWISEGHNQYPLTRDTAVEYLMLKDMENKWKPLQVTVSHSRREKSLFVCVRLIAKGVKHPPFPD